MEEITDVVNRLYTLRAGLSVMCKLTDKMFDEQLRCLGELNKATDAFGIPDSEYYHGIWTTRRSYSYETPGSIIFDYPAYSKYGDGCGHKWYMETSRFGERLVCDVIHNFADNTDEYKYKDGYHHFGSLSEKIKFYPAFKEYVMITKGASEESITSEMFKITRQYRILPTDDMEVLLTWLCSDEGEKHCVTHLQKLMSCKKGLFRRPRFKNDIANLQLVIDGLPEYRARAEKVIAQRDAALKSLRAEYNVLLDALRREYNALLDERDWKYIDYIIFALETRRADNMKEALRYVDDEVRTNRIVNAMQQATAQICKTIVEQTDRLISAMQMCTAQLCATVAAVGTQISGQLAHLTSAVELNNALVEKSNVSSQHILDVINTARLYS